jgi:hypothetical protein
MFSSEPCFELPLVHVYPLMLETKFQMHTQPEVKIIFSSDVYVSGEEART